MGQPATFETGSSLSDSTADRAITGGSKIDLKHVVPNVPSAMWALCIIIIHPSPQDVVELRTTEADEEVQAFALDRADERLRKGVCIGRPVRDLDDPSGL